MLIDTERQFIQFILTILVCLLLFLGTLHYIYRDEFRTDPCTLCLNNKSWLWDCVPDIKNETPLIPYANILNPCGSCFQRNKELKECVELPHHARYVNVELKIKPDPRGKGPTT